MKDFSVLCRILEKRVYEAPIKRERLTIYRIYEYNLLYLKNSQNKKLKDFLFVNIENYTYIFA